MYVAEVESFQAAMQKDVEPNASGRDGLRVAQVTLAAFQAVREGRKVSLEL